jgi:hypothetical protein
MAIAHTQTTHYNRTIQTSSEMSVTIGATTAGNLLVFPLAFFEGEAATVTNISGAGTWASATLRSGDSNSHTQVWYCPNISGGVTSLSVGNDGAGGGVPMVLEGDVIEVSGAATVSPLDIDETATGSSNTASDTTGTLTEADSLVIMMASHTGADLTGMSADTADGFTEVSENLDNDDGQTYHTQRKITTVTDSLTVSSTFTGTASGSRAWWTSLVVFKGAGGGAPTNAIIQRSLMSMGMGR